jgi:hypothetical protein
MSVHRAPSAPEMISGWNTVTEVDMLDFSPLYKPYLIYVVYGVNITRERLEFYITHAREQLAVS